MAVKASAREGKANEGVVDALAGYFGVPKSSVRILVGGRGGRRWWRLLRGEVVEGD